MLFKLSMKNMKKSFKDYAVYFLTLVFGVAIFYMFNSLDSQQAMMDVSSNTRDIIKLMIEMLSYISVFIAIVLGLLIVYANNFLINRRKKEFGIYMSLGMGKWQISKIILLETIVVGILSLIVGLVLGVFGSQLMSVLVAKLFEANMTKFEFVFSKDACIKTCIYFAIIYVAVMFFNAIAVSKYKLINLLTAVKKNEKVKMKNPVISVIVFIISVGMLGYAYWSVTAGLQNLTTADRLLQPIIMGIVGTILLFWSMSGFVLKIVQSRKSTYLKGTNIFVLRQLNNKINTTVVSMSVISIMLFMTISVLSSSLALRNSMEKSALEMSPVDVNLYKPAYLTNADKDETEYNEENNTNKEKTYTKEQIEDSKKPISSTLKNNGYDMNNLKDVIEMPIFKTDELTFEKTLGDYLEELKKQFPLLNTGFSETIVRISDYNKLAKLYGIDEYQLDDDEYMIVADFENMIAIRNKALEKGSKITINGAEYKPKYGECKNGYIEMATGHINSGIILVPDSCEFKDSQQNEYFLAANYNATSDKQKEEMEDALANNQNGIAQKIFHDKGIEIDGITKISILEASVGLTTIIVFIAIYLGIVFLIASAAILALKQLTESSDNKQRYTILRKIGCDEKMINSALFKQIAIFFMLPLVLAIVHSIFGVQFMMEMFSVIASKDELLPSVIATAVIIGVVYGAYFLATYFGSKSIIKEDD